MFSPDVHVSVVPLHAVFPPQVHVPPVLALLLQVSTFLAVHAALVPHLQIPPVHLLVVPLHLSPLELPQ